MIMIIIMMIITNKQSFDNFEIANKKHAEFWFEAQFLIKGT